MDVFNVLDMFDYYTRLFAPVMCNNKHRKTTVINAIGPGGEHGKTRFS